MSESESTDNDGGRAVHTMSAQKTLPDSTSRARTFRTWDLAPALEKYFLTSRLCSLCGFVVKGRMLSGDDRCIPSLVSYQGSRRDVRNKGQNSKGVEERVVHRQEGKSRRLDDARLVAESNDAESVRGVRCIWPGART